MAAKKPTRPRITPDTADLSDPLWTNAHLRRFFRCGATALCAIKKNAGFPAAARVGGLQRYSAEEVKSYFNALLKEIYDQKPSRRYVTTTEGATQ